ncbi:MAG: hypothetical protein ACNI3C_09665 [Candidatus Marinarcus sp.]|uniref:hypothetical protein n=1 Tax=Candidatus Marinarcus sp. TaxID=3100987 RepID=UPI003AFF7598
MSYYYFIDVALFLLIAYCSYYSYQKKIYLKIFEYFKIFVLITLSAKFASKMGLLLEDSHVINADSFAMIVLIGFGVNILLILNSYQFIFKLFNNYINNQSIREFCAKSVTLLEITIIITFSLYLLMQITLSKNLLYNSLKKSYSYVHIKHFYTKFLNDDFVYMVLNTDTKTNRTEVIFKSIKNAF